jgi:UDP-glucose 4-epimerase
MPEVTPQTRRPVHALITGGAGFIGSHLSEALTQRGDSVTVLDDLSTGRIEHLGSLPGQPGFRFVRGSINDSELVDRLTAEADIVFHLAAAVGVQLIVDNPLKVIETNVLGGHTVLEAARRHGCRVLVASTSEIYGKATKVPFQEDDDRILGSTTKSRWSYSTSKAVDEFLAFAYHKQYDLPVVVVRLFNTVGPRQTGQYGMVVPRFVQQALRGDSLTVYGDGQQSRCFCDVDDVIRAIVGLSDSRNAAGRVFNVGSQNEVTIRELAERVIRRVAEARGEANAIDLDDRIKAVPYEQAYGEGYEDMRRRIPDTSRIRDAIGWEPRISLDETLRRVIAYYRTRIPAPASGADRLSAAIA